MSKIPPLPANPEIRGANPKIFRRLILPPACPKFHFRRAMTETPIKKEKDREISDISNPQPPAIPYPLHSLDPPLTL